MISEPLCLNCPEECQTCSSQTQCTSCALNYYLIRSKLRCVEFGECPEARYPERENRVCERCNYICKTCVGPAADQCIKCNYIAGFVKEKNEYISGCMRLFCSQRFYEHINHDGSRYCAKCHQSCFQCKGPLLQDCLKCGGEYIYMNNGSEGYCLTCPDLHLGFKQGLPGSTECAEICGDGRNMGILPCDDGNLDSGDGCDELCNVETGYQCSGGNRDQSDICIDNIHPQAKIINIHPNYTILILFTEKVRISQSIGNLYCNIYIYRNCRI